VLRFGHSFAKSYNYKERAQNLIILFDGQLELPPGLHRGCILGEGGKLGVYLAVEVLFRGFNKKDENSYILM
jgi:hypothetical protein